MYAISIFSLFLILEWSTLSVELNFTTIVVFLAKLADFSSSIMAHLVMASYFWKKFKKAKKRPMLNLEELKNSQCLEIGRS